MSLSLVAIFGAGLATFVSPCVLPLLPIYLATITGEALASARPGRTLAVASAFALGLTLVFVALGALASTVGAALTEHRPVILVLSGAAMILFGLRSLQVFRLALFEREARPALARVRSASTLAGAFLFGAAFALGWSPCIGPVLASVLSYAAANADTPWLGAGYLALYAAGLALPLIALAAVASRAQDWIGRARPLIPTFEKLTGAALFGIGLWTIFTVTNPGAAATGATAVASAPAAPDDQASAPAAPDGQAGVTCEVDEAGTACALPAVAAAEPAASPQSLAPSGAHMLEFTSADCPVCQRMRPVLERAAHSCSALRDHRVAVDVQTPEGRALADRHTVLGTPTYIFVDDRGRETGRVIGQAPATAITTAAEDAFGC